ncbi:two-component sensor histidine kinase [Clostridium gelidum]|uniref:histidine kinase n=1 Tax=Clostridium gelidum TaxID=704125 RepID=A0ABN6J1Z4_9CLOT|nr:HAMP domain-containing sensor histidine kinase [Clostridium gelidum]BCZ46772.1 two-component sensor histidine kinase [Clostridium gelidum]
MDIKLKNISKPIKLNIIAILVLVLTSFGIISSYPLIKNIGKDNSSSPYENNDILKIINQTSYILYKDSLEKQNGADLTYDEVYVKSSKYKESGKYNDYLKYNDFKKNFNNKLEEWDEYFGRSLKNLNYFAYGNDIEKGKTNTENKLSELVNTIDNKELNNIYDFYMVVHYDENGGVEVTNVHGADEYTVRNRFSEFNFKRSFDNNLVEENEVKFNSIKNATFVYAIPKELKFEDNISVLVNSPGDMIDYPIVAEFILIIGCSIGILSLLMPYKVGKEILGIKNLLKIPFEINFSILIGGIFVLGELSIQVVKNTLNNKLIYYFLGNTNNNQFDKFIVIILNLILWIVFTSFIFENVMFLKHIFKPNIITYIKENLLTIKFFKLLKKLNDTLITYIKRVTHELSNIDLTDKSNKFIIKIVVIDAAVILVFFILWVLGILITWSFIFSAFWGLILAFTYCTVMFNLLKKYLIKIKNNYAMLLDATNKIAEGNLDVKINEDLGLFNPFKEQVVKIQNGFKKAVNEEVKSQSMKTELISNVSHDLKTPLTSIITYVDLLKNENITEDERKSYIETLDKKSQRLKFLIEDLFEVSRATSGNINLNLVKVDIGELMKQTEIELEDKIKNTNLKIRNNFPGNKIILTLDSQKTFRIFENLLNNVVKYAMEGSRVYVDIIDHEDKVEINIKNMSAEEITFDAFDIVERFERGDKSRNTEGSGLGLAIAKSFVEVQGGNFNIEVDGDLFKVIIIFKK